MTMIFSSNADGSIVFPLVITDDGMMSIFYIDSQFCQFLDERCIFIIDLIVGLILNDTSRKAGRR